MQNNESVTPNNDPASEALSRNRSILWMATVGTFLSLAGIAGVGYGIYTRNEAARTIESQQTAFQTTISQMRQQMQQDVQAMQDRLADHDGRKLDTLMASASNSAAASQPAAETAAAAKTEEPTAPKPAQRVSVQKMTAKRSPVQRAKAAPPVDDPRFKQLEQKLSEQDEKLSSTQRLVDNNHTDLTGQIRSNSEELRGSIARTSEEVAALRRRGERDYVEFDIPKSKDLSRVGPFSLALRKTDPKHKRYNVDMMVDDNRLEKKNVNLLEPVYITSPEWTQPAELVVNRVDKDRIKGYISTPKFKKSELADTSSTPRTKLQPDSNPLEQQQQD